MGLQSIGLCLLFCVCVIEMTGSSSQRRFIQTEENLLMTVTEEVKLRDYPFFWKFNKNKNIVVFTGDKNTTFDNYKGRVVFFQNLSLILKNVRLSDSGIYTAVVTRGEDDIVASYDVKVEAPVSPVTVSVDSVSVSSESCNFTVSCSTDDSTISISRSFTCDRLTCEEPRPLTPGHALSDPAPSLHLNLSDGWIICNHSNHVSWESGTKNIQDVCTLFVPPEKNIGVIIAGVVVTAAVVLCLSIAAVVLRKRRKNQRIILENTVYASPQEQSPRPAPDLLPDTIYSTVQPHSAPTPTPTPAPVQSPPESVYAKVNKPQNPAASLLSPSQPGQAD